MSSVSAYDFHQASLTLKVREKGVWFKLETRSRVLTSDSGSLP
jgi:hypothetical protein